MTEFRLTCCLTGCRYVYDFILHSPMCRQCMVNTVKNIINEHPDCTDEYTSKFVEDAILGRIKDRNVDTVYNVMKVGFDGLVEIENNNRKKRGYTDVLSN